MRSLARQLLGLPPRKYRAKSETLWLPLADGVRLATSVLRPVGAPERTPAVLIRTARPGRARVRLTAAFSALLAECGYAVVVQECRGRHGSEGVFTPFESDVRDGGEAVSWVAEQPWCDGRLALLGFGYSGYAAWAALAGAPERVGALVVGFAARNPHAALFWDGALELANALRFATLHSERDDVAESRVDWERGSDFRPVREADRVALRRVDFYRDWLDHPAAGAFWQERTPALPPSPPPTLLLSGWYDPALRAQLADYSTLSEAGGARPELVVGPWLPGRPARRQRLPRGEGALQATLRETLDFLERRLGGGTAASRAAVRVFVGPAEGWHESPSWPPPEARELCLHLRSGGRANSLVGDGRLDEQGPPDAEPADRFGYDPSDPVPTRGGALAGAGCGPADQRELEARADVLCYTSAPLEAERRIVGPVRVRLFAASSEPDTDFTAKLVAVDADGIALNVCEGIVRCRWRDGGEEPVWLEPDAPVELTIDLGACGVRLPARHRIRLEISSSNHPRFDRNANTRASPEHAAGDAPAAQQSVFHDAARPSRLLLSLV